MTFRNFISRLNWRQIVIHLVAFWFFIHAFQTLSYLCGIKLIDAYRHSHGQLTYKALIDNGIKSNDLAHFVFWTSASGFIGLLVALMISLIISIRRHWFWVNALIPSIVMYLLYRLDLLGWTYLKQAFWYLGRKFSNTTIEFMFNGMALLVIGLLIFFLKRPNQFIENNKLATT